jgi:anti-sigma regulatory factor (Ser/Thr protein kinase)
MRIPCDLSLVKPVRDLVASLCRLEGFDDERISEVTLVVTELVNNAIEHTGPPTTAEIRGGSYEDRLEIAVIDQAPVPLEADAFEFDGPPDADNERGRGLFLVKAFADEVRLSRAEGGGNRIEVVWRRENGSTADE